MIVSLTACTCTPLPSTRKPSTRRPTTSRSSRWNTQRNSFGARADHRGRGPKSTVAVVTAPGNATMPEFFEARTATRPQPRPCQRAQPPLQPAAPFASPPMARLAGAEVEPKDSTTNPTPAQRLLVRIAIKIGSSRSRSGARSPLHRFDRLMPGNNRRYDLASACAASLAGGKLLHRCSSTFVLLNR